MLERHELGHHAGGRFTRCAVYDPPQLVAAVVEHVFGLAVHLLAPDDASVTFGSDSPSLRAKRKVGPAGRQRKQLVQRMPAAAASTRSRRAGEIGADPASSAAASWPSALAIHSKYPRTSSPSFGSAYSRQAMT